MSKAIVRLSWVLLCPYIVNKSFIHSYVYITVLNRTPSFFSRQNYIMSW